MIIEIPPLIKCFLVLFLNSNQRLEKHCNLINEQTFRERGVEADNGFHLYPRLNRSQQGINQSSHHAAA